MLNFICITVVCVQQYLGTGHITASDKRLLIWNGSRHDYVCLKTAHIYGCRRINLETDYWYR